MQNRLPVICATDLVTDIGEIAVNNNFGFKCLTSDHKSFFDLVNKLVDNDLRFIMGNNGFEFLKKEYDVEISYGMIVRKINS